MQLDGSNQSSSDFSIVPVSNLTRKASVFTVIYGLGGVYASRMQ
jgi:hypothetical protein